ncbi:hypothetical protein BGZ73_007961 [Actinomortierella ambigua]|nr:hypothetical protein BGZ73_007961 [Actinomortierella ambigua]
MSHAACAMCDQIDVLLKPCNSSLGMDKWSGQFTYSVQPSPTATNTNLPATSNPGQSSSHSLSSGAIAGIIVSIVALIVALSVAGYVYARRKKEKEQREADEIYKYGDDQRTSYMEVPLPQYTGMIQPTLPPLPNITNLRVTNPDTDDEEANHHHHQLQHHHQHPDPPFHHEHQPSFEVKRNSSPGWRRGSFDDD